MKTKQSIIVLGEGLLGREIIRQTGWDFLSRRSHGLNIFDTESYFNKLDQYDAILNCIACTKTYSEDKHEHWNVNYRFVSVLSEYCCLKNKKLVHISTDHVYAGSRSNATEEDVPVHMDTWYGYTKLLGDAHVQLKVPNFLIVRTSHKPKPFPWKEAWIDQITNGDYVDVISSMIVRLVNKDAKGVYNVGTDLKTWHSHTQNEYKTSPVRKIEKAPRDISMNLSKMKSYL